MSSPPELELDWRRGWRWHSWIYRVERAGELIATERRFSLALSVALVLDADLIVKVDARRPLRELSRWQGQPLALLLERRRATVGWSELD